MTRAADRRAATPLIPPAIRTSRPVLSAFVLGAAVNYGLTTILFVLPLQDASHRALTTGAMLLPMTVPIAVNPLITVKLVRRFGSVPVITGGLIALMLGVAGLIASGELAAPYPARAAALIVCGLGISWALPSLVAYAVNAAPVGAVGAVGGPLNASRQIGATAAAATAAGLVARDDVHTSGLALGIAAAVIAAAVAIALTQLTKRIPK